MKKLILGLIIASSLVGCSSDKLLEITYKDNKKDTIMTNACYFVLQDGYLSAVRSRIQGGPYLIVENVKFYQIIK